MVVITFPDEMIERKAVGFLLGRFSGIALNTGEHIVPEAAMTALASQNIPFRVIRDTPSLFCGVNHDAR
jgi:hypothetical protein